MKKNYTLLIVATMFLFACGGSSSNDENTNENDSLSVNSETVEDIEIQTIDFCFETDFPELNAILQADQKMLETITSYATKIYGQIINSEQQITEIIDMRKQIIDDYEFSQVLENAYYDYPEDKIYDYWDKVDLELNKIGFQTIYAEGMFVGIDYFSFLEKEIEQYFSLEMKLFVDLENAYANCMGGEYPYMGLDEYGKTVVLAEKILKEYPNHTKKAEIEEILSSSLYPFTDYHKVVTSNMDEYCVGNLSYDVWPMGTDIGNHKNFLDKYPDSKYHSVIQKIYDDPSVIEFAGGEMEPTYIIVVNRTKDYEESNSLILSYLNKGMDIPHNLSVKENGKNVNVVAYRFFANRAMADDALKTVKKDFREAEMIKVDAEMNVIQ